MQNIAKSLEFHTRIIIEGHELFWLRDEVKGIYSITDKSLDPIDYKTNLWSIEKALKHYAANYVDRKATRISETNDFGLHFKLEYGQGRYKLSCWEGECCQYCFGYSNPLVAFSQFLKVVGRSTFRVITESNVSGITVNRTTATDKQSLNLTI